VHSRGFCTSQRLHLARMVNVRFPRSVIYGFEMVDEPGSRDLFTPGASIKNLRRIETRPDFSGHFPRIFDDLTSRQTLPFYRPLLVTCELRTNRKRR
jgi:hypothetical protein